MVSSSWRCTVSSAYNTQAVIRVRFIQISWRRFVNTSYECTLMAEEQGSYGHGGRGRGGCGSGE